MSTFIRFIRENPNLLAFGFSLTLFSSFGQTFLLSLYVPEIAEMLGITTGKMGLLYSIATLGSAAILTWAGRYIDFVNLRKYSLFIVAGCVIALVTLSQANGIVLAILGILGLRLTGQGLMGHTSVTTMARYFDKSRGKAISVATLGFPAGEAFFPIVVAFAMAAYGWRNTLLLSALAVGSLLTALVLLFLRKVNTQPPLTKVKRKDRSEDQKASSFIFLRKRNFWIIAPNVFMLGFINTAIFFYQVPLGEFKGWSKEWVAASLAAFAASSALSMFTAGPLVDRFTAKRLFPFYLFPYLVGLLLLASFSAPWVYPATLLLLGFSNGLGSTIKNALQAELFGVTFLGSVRSLFTVLMVISTALGPLIYGLFIDAGVSYNWVIGASAVAIVVCILQSFRVQSAPVYGEND